MDLENVVECVEKFVRCLNVFYIYCSVFGKKFVKENSCNRFLYF